MAGGRMGRSGPRKSANGEKKQKNGGKSTYPGIVQGVGATPTRPFGGRRRTRKQQKFPLSRCLNAFLPDHLTLPRAVGPYTVVRVTQNFTINNNVAIFGPMQIGDVDAWSLIVCAASIDAASAINAANNCSFRQLTAMRETSWSASQCTPAAFSVQIMNPNALQTTSGILYGGKLKTVPDLSDDTRTWATFANEFVAYNTPRLMSAGKLALRGIQMNAVPMNMSTLADFLPRGLPTDTNPQFNTTWGSAGISPTHRGMTPLVMYNPSGLTYNALVCVEWRVRFDPSNPAQASHTTHPPATDDQWAQVLKYAEEVGNSVMDIAEVVAQVGETASTIAAVGAAGLALI